MSFVNFVKKLSFSFITLPFFFHVPSAFAQQYYSSYSITTNVGNPPVPTAPNNIPPSSDTCGGTYDLSVNPNFGDPICDFTKNNLLSFINTLEPNQNWQKCWYYVIAPWESSYDPNAYLKASTSGSGAYGLFQMNPYPLSKVVPTKTPQQQNNYDVGDVYWKVQTAYAILHNAISVHNGGTPFNYWDPRTLAHDTHGWCK